MSSRTLSDDLLRVRYRGEDHVGMGVEERRGSKVSQSQSCEV